LLSSSPHPPSPPHHFATHATGPVLEHVFLVPNETGAAFEITAVKTQCGCTVTQGYDTLIEPGQTGRIPVQLKTREVVGRFRKTIAVTTTNPAEPTMTLVVTGTVLPRIELSGRAVDFGKVSPESPGATA